MTELVVLAFYGKTERFRCWSRLEKGLRKAKTQRIRPLGHKVILTYLTAFLFCYSGIKSVHFMFLAKYTMSRRGKTLLSVQGFTFCAQSVTGPKTRWVCSTHNHRRCRALVHTLENHIIKMKNEHNHDMSLHRY